MTRGMRGRLAMLAMVAVGAMVLCGVLALDPVGRMGGWLARPDRRAVPVDRAKAEGAGRRWRERHRDPEEWPGFVGPPRSLTRDGDASNIQK